MKNQKLNLFLLLFAFAILPYVTVSQEYSTNDLNLSVTGLSKEYESMFSKDKFISLYNREGIEPESLKPIELNVNYSDEVGGMINLVVNYKHKDVFSPHSQFTKLNQNNRNFLGDGISIFFLNPVFNVLQRYKLEIARKNRETRIMNFFISVTLQKDNSNNLTFLAAPDRRGYSIFNFAYLKYDNQEYEIYSPQSDLSKRKFFKFGKKTDLSGTKTGFYYLNLFFMNQIDIEEFIDNEANRKKLDNAINESKQIVKDKEIKNKVEKNIMGKVKYGVTYSLSNRTAISMVKPAFTSLADGIIVVIVEVDKNGEK